MSDETLKENLLNLFRLTNESVNEFSLKNYIIINSQIVQHIFS